MATLANHAAAGAVGSWVSSLFSPVVLSWILAVTVTPLAGVVFLKPSASDQGKDPYGSRLYRAYAAFLELCLRRRIAVVWTVAGALALSVVAFGFVDKSFFPSSTRQTSSRGKSARASSCRGATAVTSPSTRTGTPNVSGNSA